MRLFIALPLPDDTLRSLMNIQEPIRDLKWQEAEQMHLTLRFLGNTSNSQLYKLKPELNTIRKDSFSIHINHVGSFPNNHKPRVIWAGIKPSDQLTDLQQTIEMQCRTAGFEAEKRPFKPHITLGRVKKASKKEVKAFLKNKNEEISSLKVPVSHFNLYRSELKKEGAVHHVMEEYPLGS